MTNSRSHPVTRAVRSGLGGGEHRSVTPPIHLTSTFEFEAFDQPGAHDYTRTSNPTRDLLAVALAELEQGIGSTITSSGMSALLLACQLLSPGDKLVAPHDCYGGTHRLLTSLSERGQFDVLFVDQGDETALRQAFEQQPRLVLVETPSNPLLRITDIQLVADLCSKAGATLAVDNTFLSPGLQRPIPLGADLVIHSTTKYLNGHSDVVGGAVVAADQKLHDEMQWWANCLGLSGAPFDSYLTLRGLRTLYTRLRAHEANTEAIVALLCDHPEVAKVHYPGLADHPGHEIAGRQQDGYGAMVSFELAGGRASAEDLVQALNHFFLAESLGGVESLVAHPATMTHAAMSAEAREVAGIGEGLVRLSIGIEDVRDLTDDLARALDRVAVRSHAPNVRFRSIEPEPRDTALVRAP